MSCRTRPVTGCLHGHRSCGSFNWSISACSFASRALRPSIAIRSQKWFPKNSLNISDVEARDAFRNCTESFVLPSPRRPESSGQGAEGCQTEAKHRASHSTWGALQDLKVTRGAVRMHPTLLSARKLTKKLSKCTVQHVFAPNKHMAHPVIREKGLAKESLETTRFRKRRCFETAFGNWPQLTARPPHDSSRASDAPRAEKWPERLKVRLKWPLLL